MGIGESKKYLYRCDVAATLLFAAAAIFVTLRIPYTFGGVDESYFLAIPYRFFILGDAPIVDEWHPAQLSSFLLYAPIKVFVWLNDSTDGMIITFRYCYVFIALAVCSFIYRRLRTYGLPMVFALFIFLIFDPSLSLISLNYRTFGAQLVVLTGVMLVRPFRRKYVSLFIAGFIFALSVLCCPFMAAVYILYCIFIAARAAARREASREIFTGKGWLCVTGGIVLAAIPVIAFILYRASPSQLIASVPNLFTDPEFVLGGSGKGANVFTFITSLKEFFFDKPVLVISYSVLFAAVIIDKGRIRRRALYLHIGAAAAIVSCILSFSFADITFFGTLCYALSQSRDRVTFYGFMCLSMTYVIAYDAASMGGYESAKQMFIVTMIPGYMLIADAVRELRAQYLGGKRRTKIESKGVCLMPTFVAALFVLGIGYKCVYFAAVPAGNEVYYSRDYTDTDVRITHGTNSGVYTTIGVAEMYDKTTFDLDILRELDGSVMVADGMCWTYLYLEKPMSTYSAFTPKRTFLSYNGFERLASYYALNPDRVPDYIYVPYFWGLNYRLSEGTAKEMVERFDEMFDFEVFEGRAGYILEIQ